MDQSDFRELLKRALALDHPYPVRLFEPKALAGVLVLWAFDDSGIPNLLLTKRTETVATHRGQVAFPGGMTESTDADSIQAALREAREEVGLDSSGVDVLGVLPSFVTTSFFDVTPVVAIHERLVRELVLTINEWEIDSIFWAPLATLQEQRFQKNIPYTTASGLVVQTPSFQVGEFLVWGATAYLVQNLIERLERVTK